jgi:hypothetical protein
MLHRRELRRLNALAQLRDLVGVPAGLPVKEHKEPGVREHQKDNESDQHEPLP